MKTAIIIGAGPAGLTAAYEFLKTTDIHPVILEETDEIGGLSRTVVHQGNRIDIGGHRFFSKNTGITDFWKSVMPVQGSAARDDLCLRLQRNYVFGGPDPEKEERVMLIRRRISRIFYLRKFFDYPIKLKPETFFNLGFVRTFRAGTSYLRSMVFKRREVSLKDFIINRFGTVLYRMFFEKYTEKVWGRNPDVISAAWGSQRIKGLSLWKACMDFWNKRFHLRNDVENSLIEEFIYPKKGPGQFWEYVATDIQAMGGELWTRSKVIRVKHESGKIVSVTVLQDGKEKEFSGDLFFSSMPVKDLVECMESAPPEVRDIAAHLPYRDFITVGMEVSHLKITNTTKLKTVGNRIPDCWIYVQEEDCKIGRIQIFNNWSPYMVRDCQNKIWLGLEFFCNEGDELWTMPEDKFVEFSKSELEKIGFIDVADVSSTVVIHVKKAYPAYFGSYEHFDELRLWLDGISNLYCIGRNGQHRYNNMDHSMLTAMEAVRSIRQNTDKRTVWKVNTEEEYHETKAGDATVGIG